MKENLSERPKEKILTEEEAEQVVGGVAEVREAEPRVGTGPG